MIQKIEQAIIAHLRQQKTGIFNPLLIRDEVTGKDPALNEEFQKAMDALAVAGKISADFFWKG